MSQHMTIFSVCLRHAVIPALKLVFSLRHFTKPDLLEACFSVISKGAEVVMPKACSLRSQFYIISKGGGVTMLLSMSV